MPSVAAGSAQAQSSVLVSPAQGILIQAFQRINFGSELDRNTATTIALSMLDFESKMVNEAYVLACRQLGQNGRMPASIDKNIDKGVSWADYYLGKARSASAPAAELVAQPAVSQPAETPVAATPLTRTATATHRRSTRSRSKRRTATAKTQQSQGQASPPASS